MVVYGIVLVFLSLVDVNCDGSWVPQGECDAKCDGTSETAKGKREEIYNITTPPKGDGDECTDPEGATRSVECDKTDCKGTIF